MKRKRVILVRHAEAADGAGRDEDRPLTDEGRERMRRNAAALAAAAEPAPELWLCSPLVRAVQTCEICVGEFDPPAPVEITRALLPGAPAGALAEAIDARPERSLALVGHEPLLSAVAAHLLGLSSLGGPFEKGAAIAVDLPRGGGAGTLAFRLRPAGSGRAPSVERRRI